MVDTLGQAAKRGVRAYTVVWNSGVRSTFHVSRTIWSCPVYGCIAFVIMGADVDTRSGYLGIEVSRFHIKGNLVETRKVGGDASIGK